MGQQAVYSRRTLLGQAAVGGTALLWGRRVLGANTDIRVAVVGLGNKGRHHVRVLKRLPGVRLVALCDVDPKRLGEQTRQCPGVFAATDPRKVLDRRDVDVMVIATPDHWHAVLAVWACQAGMDVYVEKPVSHSLHEGRKIIEAATRYKRIVQSGTQYRSDKGLQEAAQYIREGHLGRMLWGHVVWYERRGSIGKVAPHTPDWLDYDLYCGPAEVRPLRREKLHYDWHWVWPTGTGDLGNSGIHAFDVCRWFAGFEGLPPRAMCLGGRFAVDDAGETPNTQLTVLDYPDAPILIEDRNLPTRRGTNALDHYRGIREGVILQCENGYFAGLRGGGWVYDENGKKIKQFVGDGGREHHANFFEAVRSRNPGLLNAPIQEGHVSSACCHLGNLSYRVGSPAKQEALRQITGEFRQAGETVDRLLEHLRANEVDLKRTPMTAGPWLTLDEQTEEIVRVEGGDGSSPLAQARQLARGSHRPPFLIPEQI
mgnify:FL=1